MRKPVKSTRKEVREGRSFNPLVRGGLHLQPRRERFIETEPGTASKTLRLVGTIPPELWNRLGTKVISKLRSGSELRIGVDFTVTTTAESAAGLEAELRQILQELGLGSSVLIE